MATLTGTVRDAGHLRPTISCRLTAYHPRQKLYLCPVAVPWALQKASG